MMLKNSIWVSEVLSWMIIRSFENLLWQIINNMIFLKENFDKYVFMIVKVTVNEQKRQDSVKSSSLFNMSLKWLKFVWETGQYRT